MTRRDQRQSAVGAYLLGPRGNRPLVCVLVWVRVTAPRVCIKFGSRFPSMQVASRMNGYPDSVWEYDACLQRHLDGDDDGCCPACDWCPEKGFTKPRSHAMHSAALPWYTCPYIKHKYQLWNNDGEPVCRKRDFLWVVPRLMAWKMRAVKRVESEYALDGPRGKRCKGEFECDFWTV